MCNPNSNIIRETNFIYLSNISNRVSALAAPANRRSCASNTPYRIAYSSVPITFLILDPIHGEIFLVGSTLKCLRKKTYHINPVIIFSKESPPYMPHHMMFICEIGYFRLHGKTNVMVRMEPVAQLSEIPSFVQRSGQARRRSILRAPS